MFIPNRFIITILICIITISVTTICDPILSMPQEAWKMLGLLLVMVLLWTSNFLPLGVTALLPIVYAPLVGIDTLKNITANYGNPTIFFFIGSYVLGLAMEKWLLNKRISLFVLSKVGHNYKKQLLAFMLITAFISMWLQNGTTVAVLLPIALAILAQDNNKNVVKAFIIGIAYAASVGGLETLIGTPTNTLLAGFMESNYNVRISFLSWMAFALPLAIILLVISYLILLRIFKFSSLSASSSTESYDLNTEKANLGKMNLGSKLVVLIFIITVVFWVAKDIINDFFNLNLTIDIIAIVSLLALFLTPVNLKEKKFLMDFEYMKKVPLDTVLLFGGSFALSGLFLKTGLAHWFADSLGFIGALSTILIIFIIVFVINILTELASNLAIAATFLPLIVALATLFGLNPLLLAVPLTLAASCAFMIPVVTIPNMLAFGTGRLDILDMIKTGAWLTFFAIIIISLYSYIMVPLILQ